MNDDGFSTKIIRINLEEDWNYDEREDKQKTVDDDYENCVQNNCSVDFL